MSRSNPPDLVVGAGVAGLTAAVRLLEAGRKVAVVEREAVCGGLARSFRYGHSVFDIGPHRFFSLDPAVMGFVRSVLGTNCREIPRRSAVYFMGRRYGWPFGLADLLKLPAEVKSSALRDLLVSASASDRGTYEDFVVQRYGRTVYGLFFKDYTEKFLGLPASRVDKEWAALSVERAVVDPRTGPMNLLGLALQSLPFVRRKVSFVYPDKNGVAAFSEALRAKVLALGGSIFTSETVRTISSKGKTIIAVRTSKSGTMAVRSVVWTAPLGELIRLLGGRTDLSFRSTVLFNVLLRGSPRFPYQWCYFGSREFRFSRVSVPVRFNPANAEHGTWGLCVEVVCDEGDEVWSNPGRLKEALCSDLLRCGEIRTASDILAVHIEKVRDTYPVYRAGYAAEKKRCLSIAGRYSNLHPLGRCGTFWYNNMDHSIGQALTLTETV
jgi:protoporphyrinogen oxidase